MMGGACSMHGEGEKIHTNSLSENLKRKGSVGDVGVQWRIILKWILEK